ncbi:MAG: response regulator transcription factor [Tepidibacter sp.]|jgi:DNA-binding response OmpR family regulator|uniref:response regulator transcription factor n=1 Tax=Tepidibacter sp. TaxID=2529387 RepID=UPI0025E214BB|nr:response regulator transcription factor [Tepidibacter sp.]MCT4507374.1 response regulator transcription factor [Tepidibacter sp.]
MNHKVLVIEDEIGIRKVINDFFKAEGFSIVEASDGQEGIDKFSKDEFDLVILDIMMPKLDGWAVCRRIRKKSDIPIIILTARGDEDDELMGFELNADDYVKKPFSPAILVARAKKLISKKYNGKNENQELIIRKDIKVNKLSREVFINDDKVNLTLKCFDILWYLISNEGIVLSREKMLEEIWGNDYFGDTRVVDNHIKKLRKAMNEKSFYIRTIFGVGYKFEVSE